MRSGSFWVHVFWSFVALSLGAAGCKFSALRKAFSYGAAIVLLIYLFSLSGVALFSWLLKSRDFVPAGVGFFIGTLAGIGAGVFLGQIAVQNSLVYGILVVLVTGVLAWLKPLF